jgi:hypothetical protein
MKKKFKIFFVIKETPVQLIIYLSITLLLLKISLKNKINYRFITSVIQLKCPITKSIANINYQTNRKDNNNTFSYFLFLLHLFLLQKFLFKSFSDSKLYYSSHDFNSF